MAGPLYDRKLEVVAAAGTLVGAIAGIASVLKDVPSVLWMSVGVIVIAAAMVLWSLAVKNLRAIAVAATTEAQAKSAALAVAASTGPAGPPVLVPLDVWLEINPPERKLQYPYKLRIVVANASERILDMARGQWASRSPADIAFQPISLVWRAEGPNGWAQKSFSGPEVDQIVLRPGGVAEIWIPLAGVATDEDVRRRLVTHRLGKLTVPIKGEADAVLQF